MHIDAHLPVLNAGPQHRQFQLAQFPVTNDQKIATAAGRVKKRECAQLLVELKQPVFVAFDLFKLGP
jgi:hypothetical protein